MARYPKSSPFYEKNIRVLSGSSIFVEAALTAGGIWKDIELEELIYEQLEIEKNSCSGQFRRMLTEGCLPEAYVCNRTQKALCGGQLKLWRNYPLWPLLSNIQNYNEFIEQALKSIRSRIRHRIWSIPSDVGDRRFSTRAMIEFESITEVANYQNLEALLTLTAWAREARQQNIQLTSFRCAYEIRRIFAFTVCNNPHLYIRWPLLADLYKQRIWSFLKTEISEPWLNIRWDELIDEIYREEKIARHNKIPLPPPDLVRRINKPYLRSLQ